MDGCRGRVGVKGIEGVNSESQKEGYHSLPYRMARLRLSIAEYRPHAFIHPTSEDLAHVEKMKRVK